jgi:hypothetical protein
MFNTKVVHNFKIYSFVIEHNSKFKALLQFIHINVYIGSIVPTFWTPKRLYAKKVLNTKKMLKISKPKVLLYNKN